MPDNRKNETWFKRVFTKEEFLDIQLMSKQTNGIRDASRKYKCGTHIIRQRLKSGNKFKGLPSQNKLKYTYDDFNLKTEKPNVYYLLGLIASDGCVRGNRLNISQSGDKGKRLIIFVKGILSSNHKLHNNKNANAINIKIESNLKDLLIKHNITERKTYTYTLPDFKNEDNFYAFLQGYIEGDGCTGIYNNGKGVFSLHISVVGTKEFIYKVNNKLPIKGSVRNIKNELYELAFWGINAFKASLLIYKNPIYIHGKYKNVNKSFFLYKKQISIKKTCENILKLTRKNIHTTVEISKRFNISVKYIYDFKWKRRKLSQHYLKKNIKSKDL